MAFRRGLVAALVAALFSIAAAAQQAAARGALTLNQPFCVPICVE
jgi:hypothetical protein